MALKKRDKIAVGLLFFAGAIFIVMIGTLPTWDAFSANLTKLGQLETDVNAKETAVASLKDQIANIQDNVPLPPGVELRKFKPGAREEVVKAILNDVTKEATDPGNKLIYLLPYQAEPIVQPLTAEEQQLVAEGKMSPPVSPYDTMGYELAVRGTYGSIQDFLAAMDAQKELIEVVSVALINEAGVDRAGTKAPTFSKTSGEDTFSDIILDPSKPIRLTAQLRLILERE